MSKIEFCKCPLPLYERHAQTGGFAGWRRAGVRCSLRLCAQGLLGLLGLPGRRTAAVILSSRLCVSLACNFHPGALHAANFLNIPDNAENLTFSLVLQVLAVLLWLALLLLAFVLCCGRLASYSHALFWLFVF